MVTKTDGYADRLKAQRQAETKAAKKRAKSTWDDRRAQRAIDTVAVMAKKRQLDPFQVLAANSYREAHATVLSPMNGTRDPSKIGVAGNSTRAPSPTVMIVTERLNETTRWLGLLAP